MQQPDVQDGTRMGPYRVVTFRGRGGMATVYEAERADGAYRQRVALKVLRRGLDTADLVRRFLAERQILSSLTHPNIARLLDGGTTPDGRPFLVMELVDGEPITAYADARRLGIASRLNLFLAVADAVGAAHRQLVVHRDIKPANILVDGDGRARLLDFGIAKLLAADSRTTEAGALALTPDYASPEQVRGGAITTATDVYQLGLLLRELLTGLPPQAGGNRPGEPLPRPSRAAFEAPPGWPEPATRAAARSTKVRRLARSLAGELDIIVGKALRVEPEQRYGSADELASDIRRLLSGRPIRAHPESARYRLRKFLGRHPALLPGVVLAMLALAAFLGLLARQNRRLEHQRDVATQALRRAQETQVFFTDLFRSPDPWLPADPARGREITVLEALRVGEARVRDQLAGHPALRGALLSTIGGVLLSLDQLAEARATLEESIALRARTDSGATEALSDDLGRLGVSLDGLNLRDSARVVLNRRVALERARAPTDSTRLSRALRDLATTYYYTGPLDRAVALQEEAVALLPDSEPEARAAALIHLSDGYRKVDRLADSEVAARDALRLSERAAGPDDPATALAAYTLAKTLGMRGGFEEATALFSRAVAVLGSSLGDEHAQTMNVRGDYGFLLSRMEDYTGAERVYRELLEISRRKHGGDNHSVVANQLQNLAGVLSGQGRYEPAERFTREAEAIYRRVLPPGSFVVAYPMLTRSEIRLLRRDYAGAAETADSAAAALRGLVPVTHPAAIMADCRRGRARMALGELAEARSLLASVGERLSSEGLREAHRAECRAVLDALFGEGG